MPKVARRWLLPVSVDSDKEYSLAELLRPSRSLTPNTTRRSIRVRLGGPSARRPERSGRSGCARDR